MGDDRDIKPDVLRGAAAIMDALNEIGAVEPSGDGRTDSDLAKHIVDNEMAIRELVGYAIRCLTEDI